MVPLYCINDPINYSASYHIEQLRNKQRPENATTLSLRLVNAKDGKKYEIECLNTQDVSEVKLIYGAYHDCDDISCIRLFYQGKELENDVCVDAYEINEDL